MRKGTTGGPSLQTQLAPESQSSNFLDPSTSSSIESERRTSSIQEVPFMLHATCEELYKILAEGLKPGVGVPWTLGEEGGVSQNSSWHPVTSAKYPKYTFALDQQASSHTAGLGWKEKMQKRTTSFRHEAGQKKTGRVLLLLVFFFTVS